MAEHHTHTLVDIPSEDGRRCSCGFTGDTPGELYDHILNPTAGENEG